MVVRLWNPVVTSRPTSVLTGHKAGIIDLKISPERGYLFSYSKDAVVKLWDLNKCVIVQTLSLHFPAFSVLGKEVEFGRPGLYVEIGIPDTVIAICCEHLTELRIVEEEEFMEDDMLKEPEEEEEGTDEEEEGEEEDMMTALALDANDDREGRRRGRRSPKSASPRSPRGNKSPKVGMKIHCTIAVVQKSKENVGVANITTNCHGSLSANLTLLALKTRYVAPWRAGLSL